MILAFVSSIMYTYHQPFDRPDENTLVQASSVSIFLTLLGAIMIKLKAQLAEHDAFSVILIIINTLVLGLFGVGFLFKPMFQFYKKYERKHLHDAPLKGAPPEVEYSVDLFIDHFKRLVESTAEEAGWETVALKDWSGNKNKVQAWLDETGAKMDWRCENGDGTINQARVKYVVDADVETMLQDIGGIKSRHEMSVGSFAYVMDEGKTDKGEKWRQIYYSIQLPWPFRQRDMIYTEHTRMEQGGDVLVCYRSSKEVNDMTNSLSVKFGRYRAEVRIAGYRLRGIGEGKTEIIYLSDVDLGGSFSIGYFYRKVSQRFLKGIVDMHLQYAKTSREGSVSNPPAPLPFLSRALTAAAKKGGSKGKRLTLSPMFANLQTTPSVADGLNVEMGRMMKKRTGKKDKKDDEHANDILVL
ncbi:hypothetical protein TrLO_g5715 [Triparma laevis f. longispina]|uniref:START domain-containing protein n=1 Tax=Triparma laevis f. longispina TaxID=1714387 RepID=A0A9W7E735_9STRA|nr:hypothetical protein TrLO_g5715 [Triparma laevis f. longispina]